MNAFESLTAMYTSPEYAAAYAAQQQQMNLQQQQQQSMQQYARANIDPQLQQMLAADSNALVNRWTYAESQPPTRTGSPPTPPPIIPPPQPNQYVFQGPPHFDFRPPQAAFTMPDPQPRVTPPPLYGPGSLSSPFSPTSFGQQPQASTSYALPPTGSSETPPPPTEVPGGSELARIQAEQAARAAEVEARKPDYLQRAPSGPVAGAAIGNTPLKGRRIDLLAGGGGFTHTSEESFEDRLMAGGYVGYGSTPGATAPSAPQPQARTFNEILSAHGRPPTPRANTHTSEPSPASHVRDDEDENERRKRKWLTAFSEGRQKSRAEMHAVELDNVGRVLIDLAPAEKPPEIPPDDTPKRKGGRRRKRPPRRMFGPPESAALHWPDEAFPWSVRTSEMRTEEGAAQEDALGKVEHYLCSDDTEPDEDEKPFPIPPKRSIELDTYPRIKPKGGRGKSIPKKEARRRAILFPSDSGDARAALLTNSAVRRLIEVRRAEGLAICICGKGGIVNKKQVQCDDCARWYHLSCLGLTERDLDDEYFCPTCVDDGRGEVEDEPQPPTLVRDGTLIGTMDGTGSDPLLFGGASMNEDGYPRTPSPSVTEPSSQPEPPRTPAMSASLATVFDPSSTPSRGIRAKDGSGVWSNARFGGPTGSFGTPTQTATQGLGQGSVVARGTGAGAGRFSGQYVPVPQSAGAGLEDTPVDRPTLRAGTKPVVAESPLTGRGGVSGRTQSDGSPTLRAAVAQGGLGGAGGK